LIKILKRDCKIKEKEIATITGTKIKMLYQLLASVIVKHL